MQEIHGGRRPVAGMAAFDNISSRGMARTMRITRVGKVRVQRPRRIRELVCNDWLSTLEAMESPGAPPKKEGSARRWIFRGQADAAWLLESTLVRAFKDSWQRWAKAYFWNDVMVMKRIEGQLAFDFASKAKLHGIDVSTDRPVELLSAMRHFGVPTRLVDWTYSPFVALYFALEEESSSEMAAVWAIDSGSLDRAATLKTLPVTKLPGGQRVIPPIRSVDFSRDDAFLKHVCPDFDWYHRSNLLGEPTIENVVPILPGTQNERLSAQQGLFLCPSQVGPSLMEQLDKLMRPVKHEWIVKIVIPRALRSEILGKLFQMNVHPLSLFPGADGLGRFCSLKAELFGWE
jgi:FRG domain-containing protein